MKTWTSEFWFEWVYGLGYRGVWCLGFRGLKFEVDKMSELDQSSGVYYDKLVHNCIGLALGVLSAGHSFRTQLGNVQLSDALGCQV